ncbi:MAG: hypothetical protein ACXVPN_06320 [Bacteroidia bacterium]
MATGKIKSMYPPGNSGSHPGAGKISEDGTGNTYVFQTPGDVADGIVLSEGTAVTFDVTNGKSVSNVKQVVVLPTCTLNTSATDVHLGDSVTLSWTSQNATSLIMNRGVGDLSPVSGGSIDVIPDGTANTSIIYAISASNSAGQARAGVTINLLSSNQ